MVLWKRVKKTEEESDATVPSIYESSHSCPRGHTLKSFCAPTSKISCLECNETQKAGSQLYGCEKCSYLVCSNCEYIFKSREKNRFVVSIGPTLDDGEIRRAAGVWIDKPNLKVRYCLPHGPRLFSPVSQLRNTPSSSVFRLSPETSGESILTVSSSSETTTPVPPSSTSSSQNVTPIPRSLLTSPQNVTPIPRSPLTSPQNVTPIPRRLLTSPSCDSKVYTDNSNIATVKYNSEAYTDNSNIATVKYNAARTIQARARGYTSRLKTHQHRLAVIGNRTIPFSKLSLTTQRLNLNNRKMLLVYHLSKGGNKLGIIITDIQTHKEYFLSLLDTTNIQQGNQNTQNTQNTSQNTQNMPGCTLKIGRVADWGLRVIIKLQMCKSKDQTPYVLVSVTELIALSVWQFRLSGPSLTSLFFGTNNTNKQTENIFSLDTGSSNSIFTVLSCAAPIMINQTRTSLQASALAGELCRLKKQNEKEQVKAKQNHIAIQSWMKSQEQDDATMKKKLKALIESIKLESVKLKHLKMKINQNDLENSRIFPMQDKTKIQIKHLRNENNNNKVDDDSSTQNIKDLDRKYKILEEKVSTMEANAMMQIDNVIHAAEERLAKVKNDELKIKPTKFEETPETDETFVKPMTENRILCLFEERNVSQAKEQKRILEMELKALHFDKSYENIKHQNETLQIQNEENGRKSPHIYPITKRVLLHRQRETPLLLGGVFNGMLVKTKSAANLLNTELSCWETLFGEDVAEHTRKEYAKWGDSVAEVDGEVDPSDGSVKLKNFLVHDPSLPHINGGAWWPTEMLEPAQLDTLRLKKKMNNYQIKQIVNSKKDACQDEKVEIDTSNNENESSKFDLVKTESSDVIKNLPMMRWKQLFGEDVAEHTRKEYAKWGDSIAEVDGEVDPSDGSIKLKNFLVHDPSLPHINGGAWWPTELLTYLKI